MVSIKFLLQPNWDFNILRLKICSILSQQKEKKLNKHFPPHRTSRDMASLETLFEGLIHESRETFGIYWHRSNIYNSILPNLPPGWAGAESGVGGKEGEERRRSCTCKILSTTQVQDLHTAQYSQDCLLVNQNGPEHPNKSTKLH